MTNLNLEDPNDLKIFLALQKQATDWSNQAILNNPIVGYMAGYRAAVENNGNWPDVEE